MADFGVKVDDDCRVSVSKLSCSYIKLEGEDFHLGLQGIDGDIDLMNLLGRSPVARIKVEKGDITYLNDPKAPPSDKLKGLFEIHIVTNYIQVNLKEGKVHIKELDEGVDLYIERLSFQNEKNRITVDKPDILIKQDGKTFRVEVERLGKVTVNPSSIDLEDLVFFYDGLKLSIEDGSIHERNRVSLRGNLQTFDKLSLRGISLESFNSKYDLFFIPDKKVYLRLKGEGRGLSIPNGKVWSDTVDLDVKVNGQSLSKFNSSGKIQLKNSRIQKGSLNLVVTKYELAKDEKRTEAKGEASSDLLDFRFSVRDGKLKIETQDVSIQKLSALFLEPSELQHISGRLNAIAEYDIKKGEIESRINILDFSVFDFKAINGNLDLVYNLDEDLLKLNSNLKDGKGQYTVDGIISEVSYTPLLKLNLKAYNFKLHTLDILKKLKIDGDVDFSGVVSGKLNEVSFSSEGFARSFSYEDINLRDIRFSLKYTKDKIEVKGDTTDKTLHTDVLIVPKEEKTVLNFKGNRFNPSPVLGSLQRQVEVLNFINPLSVSGDVGIEIYKEDLDIRLNLYNSVISLKDSTPLIVKAEGYITGDKVELKISGFADSFSIKGQNFKNLDVKVDIKDKMISYSFKTSLAKEDKRFELFSAGKYNTGDDSLELTLNGDGKVPIGEKVEELLLNFKTSGKLSNLRGEGSIKLDKFVLPFSLEALSRDRKVWSINLSTSTLNYPLNGFRVYLEKISGSLNLDVDKPDNLKGHITLYDLKVSQKLYNLFTVKEIIINLSEDRVFAKPGMLSGIFSGKVQNLEYSFKDGYTKILIDGSVDKKYLSEFLQLINFDGNLKFFFSYSGDLKSITENYDLRIYGDNLRLRTPYIQNILSFKTFNINAKDKLSVNIYGTTKSSYGDGFLKVSGVSESDLKSSNLEMSSKNLPVKFENLFNGTLDSSTKIESRGKEISISTEAKVSGRVRLEPEILQIGREEEKKPEIVKKTKLNLNVSTSSPILFEGSWGRAYGDLDINITGTVERPIVNGKVRVGYGKVVLMKNTYNIDFLNLEIHNNDTYVNGRLSTLVSGTNIFVNVSGPANNLRYDFFSTPPKSREEILSILLFRKTPEQVMTTGIFGVIGKFGEILIPFKVEEEEKGMFGTGINVNIIPSYSPVQGVVFSVYLQKYLTRRIYVGLSRPLSQYQLTNYVGWYEGGIKLTERTSFVIKSFENKSKFTEITFTLPFDF
ncbi:MAG: translocation/assembly module TamB domain-containing protein [Hydrogenothermaceae bacterium]|nr:translocation/assembly module TamB domain-containing protein [Hydrogenothermaceae bacterium]